MTQTFLDFFPALGGRLRKSDSRFSAIFAGGVMKSTRQQTRPFWVTILLAAPICLMTGCDGGVPATGSRTSSGAQTRLVGHVLDDEGPIARAKIEVKDAKGALVGRTDLKGEPTYALTIPAGAAYPLVISAYPEAAPNQPIKAVVNDANATEQDLSPVTTIIVDTALSLGGLTEANIAKAAGAAIAQRKQSGGAGSSAGFKGDPTKQYGGWH